jgi:hypothetical protein
MPDNAKKHIPDDVLRQMIYEYQSGKTHAELYERYGKVHNVSDDWIRRKLIASGVKMRSRGQPHGKYLPNNGRTIDKTGYVLVKVPPGSHPYANSSGYVREHRLVMEKHLGRFLSPQEVVHHKNGKKADNRIENLELFSGHDRHYSHEMQGNQYKKGRTQIRVQGDKSKVARPGKPYWTEDRILNALRNFQKDCDRPIRRVDFRPPNLPSYVVANRMFGHWSKAVWLAVGYDPLAGHRLASTPQERGIDD